MFGKSHLGMHTRAHYPINRGFDEAAGYMQGCGSKYTHVASCCAPSADPTNDTAYVCAADGEDFRGLDWFIGTTPVASDFGVASTTLIADAAVDFISRRGAPGQPPFFLYLPFQNIHAPYPGAAKCGHGPTQRLSNYFCR
jgi:hypothetical protein